MKVSNRLVSSMLRHLDDPHALRSNPLTAEFFRSTEPLAAAHERIAQLCATIRESLAAIARLDGNAASQAQRRRAATIIERCDLQGGKHDDVASELGLSRRQFYRDRSLALSLLRIELEHRLGAPHGPAVSAADSAAVAFESVEALLSVGRFGAAARALDRIARQAGDLDTRLRARAMFLEVASERNDAAAIERANAALLATLEDGVRIAPSTASRVLSARSIHAEFLRDSATAQSYRDGALALVAAADSTDAKAALEHAFALMRNAAAARVRGEHRLAVAQLEEAERIIDASADASPYLRALVYNERGAATMMVTGRLSEASQYNRRAADYARAHRMMRIACVSLLNDAVIGYWQGHPDRVVESANATLEASREVVSRDEFLRMALLVASISIDAHQQDRALELLTEVQAHANEAPTIAARATLTESHVRLGLGQFAKGVALAERAATLLGTTTLQGRALLYAAQGHAAIGDRDAALRTVCDAIPLLERCGSPFTLIRAHRLAARLTGATAHRRRARQLASNLGTR